MAEFLKRLFQSDFMPHGACWQCPEEEVDQNAINVFCKGQSIRPGPHVGLEVSDNGSGMTAEVLVVDDEKAMRAVMVAALGRAGLASLQARDGLEALDVFQAHRDQVRLILMDLTMPNMDGEEACRELRRRGAAVPIILCSGFNESEALSRFDDLDLAGFLQKPFGLGTMVDLVRRLLAG